MDFAIRILDISERYRGPIRPLYHKWNRQVYSYRKQRQPLWIVAVQMDRLVNLCRTFFM